MKTFSCGPTLATRTKCGITLTIVPPTTHNGRNSAVAVESIRREDPGIPNASMIKNVLTYDNLPEDTSQSWLKKLFNEYGVVKEVFIPSKRSKATGRRFVFVRYDCDISTHVATSKTHGMWIEECKLFVKRASFRQGEKAEPRNQKMHFYRDHIKTNSHLLESSTTRERAREDHPNMSMLQGKSYANPVKGESVAKGLVKEDVINLRMQAKETDWLLISVVAKSHLDVVVDDLVKNLNIVLMFEVQVRSLSGRNFLLTFPTTEDKNKMVQDKIFGKCLRDEKDKEDANVDIPIELGKQSLDANLNQEVGNTNLNEATTSQSWVDVDVSSNSCVGEGILALDDGNIGINSAGPLTGNHVGIEDESLAASEVEEEEEREDGEIAAKGAPPYDPFK
ncbi:hypothetical protein Vadar_010463 [Vaccinium darrowii]|uniref:Uncharacterized protein n=1 Tax=Vaccinium darrowii TaxID=229202 RepID=A0ACB7YF10_9ERIC|nr:hypothetical protein Vadar_010463 [Vaccinium darrowii]